MQTASAHNTTGETEWINGIDWCRRPGKLPPGAETTDGISATLHRRFSLFLPSFLSSFLSFFLSFLLLLLCIALAGLRSFQQRLLVLLFSDGSSSLLPVSIRFRRCVTVNRSDLHSISLLLFYRVIFCFLLFFLLLFFSFQQQKKQQETQIYNEIKSSVEKLLADGVLRGLFMVWQRCQWKMEGNRKWINVYLPRYIHVMRETKLKWWQFSQMDWNDLSGKGSGVIWQRRPAKWCVHKNI